jgi:hypothetical protein
MARFHIHWRDRPGFRILPTRSIFRLQQLASSRLSQAVTQHTVREGRVNVTAGRAAGTAPAPGLSN